jgi:TrmH family RNA methyltransferase
LITTRYTVDAFNEKVIRASMGSALRLPLITDARPEQIIARCRKHGIEIIASAPATAQQALIEDASLKSASMLYTEVDLRVPVALIFGREATGLTPVTSRDADRLVHIPMAEGVESLNVAAAAAVLLYEAARQRGFGFARGAGKQ